MKLLLFTLAWYALWSAAAFVVFWLDKRAAGRGNRRTPEKTLHLLSLAGGFPGSMLAMRVVRHKHRKPWFVTVVLSIAALHTAGWMLILTR